MNKLKKYLIINSIFSAATGLALLLFSNGFNQLFSIENQLIFPIIGISLVVFALFVWFVSKKYLTNKLLVILISGLDLLWVLGSLAIVLFGLFDLSRNGNILIGVIAVWIAFLGYKQYLYNK